MWRSLVTWTEGDKYASRDAFRRQVIRVDDEIPVAAWVDVEVSSGVSR